MERRKWFKRVGVGLIGLVGIALLGACRHGGWGGGGDPALLQRRITSHVEEVLEDIEATPEQKAKILAIKDRLLEKAKALHAGRADRMKALLAQWESPDVDTAKLHSMIDARAQEMQAFAHEAADALVEVHGILTPDQRAKIAKKWQRRMH